MGLPSQVVFKAPVMCQAAQEAYAKLLKQIWMCFVLVITGFSFQMMLESNGATILKLVKIRESVCKWGK